MDRTATLTSLLRERVIGIVRLVEAGETIRLARGGRPVLRIVPEPVTRPDDLTEAGTPAPA